MLDCQPEHYCILPWPRQNIALAMPFAVFSDSDWFWLAGIFDDDSNLLGNDSEETHAKSMNREDISKTTFLNWYSRKPDFDHVVYHLLLMRK